MDILFTIWYTIRGLFLKTFLGGIILYSIYAICLLIIKKRNKWKSKKCIAEFIFCCYFVAVLILTGVSELRITDFSEMHAMPNLIPLVSTFTDVINNGIYVLKQVVLNIAFYIPFGILVSVLLNNKKNTAIKVIIASVIMSSSTETLQYFCGRYADIDDIIFNATGALIGYFIYVIWKRLRQK